MGDDDTGGIDFGELPEILERVAREHGATDDDMPVRQVYGSSYCSHNKASINDANRQLTCRNCGAPLDAFDYLVRLTRDAERWIHARKSAEKRAREASAQLEEILRLERNARARLARLKGRERDV